MITQDPGLRDDLYRPFLEKGINKQGFPTRGASCYPKNNGGTKPREKKKHLKFVGNFFRSPKKISGHEMS